MYTARSSEDQSRLKMIITHNPFPLSRESRGCRFSNGLWEFVLTSKANDCDTLRTYDVSRALCTPYQPELTNANMHGHIIPLTTGTALIVVSLYQSLQISVAQYEFQLAYHASIVVMMYLPRYVLRVKAHDLASHSFRKSKIQWL